MTDEPTLKPSTPEVDSKFKGTIRLDVRDSVQDWTPYLAPKAPEGSPNILFVLFDDTGLGAWEPFGGKIKMPTLQKIAENGLRYTQWHTAALCSPTRGMLLTGRNHHLNGNASITEGANGFPGQHARMPDECATVAQILQDAGWSTFWVGKNHNVPETDVALGSTKKQWPLAKGFDRFYGFIGGETNQFYPDLIADNHPVEQPKSPEEGYHLSADLADQAIQMIKDQQASNPSKPWYMWFCPGANHAPHQIPKGLLEKYGKAAPDGYEYEGMFDAGYEQYRNDVLKNMKDLDILPSATLTNLNPLDGMMYKDKDEELKPIANKDDFVRRWEEVSEDVFYKAPVTAPPVTAPPVTAPIGEAPGEEITEKKLFSKLMQVYATFSTYTDNQIGRIVEYLENTKQIENTLIIYAADNGASGEGSPNGSVNENKFFNGYPDTTEENLKTVAEIGGLKNLGGEDTYEHYPTGWAAATSTPFKMFKRYSQYAGGTCCPLVISWLKGIKARGEIRHQYHHCVDIVPTILDVCGLKMPAVYKGVRQHPLSGVSMRYSFDRPNTPTRKERQYYAMLGTRGIWENGWKAVCLHAPLTGQSNFDKDSWELYHVDVDRSESNNLANSTDPEHQQKLEHLIDAWFQEAEKNMVLPLDDRSAVEQVLVERPTEEPVRDSYTYYPGTAAVPESVAVNIRGCSYTIRADVTIKEERCEGVIFAHGSRFGGHSLFIDETGVLRYVYNFLGIQEQELSSAKLEKGTYIFEVHFEKKESGPNGESVGDTTLSVNGTVVDTLVKMQAQTGKFTLCGDGLCVGYDSADAVSKLYKGTFPFTEDKGTIEQVVITPTPFKEKEGSIDPGYDHRVRLFAGAFARD